MTMVANTSFAMGVAYDIPNYRFVYGSSETGTLKKVLSGGNVNEVGNSFIQIHGTSPDIRNILTTANSDSINKTPHILDEVLLGPSTDVNHLNAVERWKIKDFTEGQAVVNPGGILNIQPLHKDRTLKYSYNDLDPFSAISGKLPEGWSTTNVYGATNAGIILHPLYQNYNKSAFFGSGSWFDDYAFSLALHSLESAWGVNDIVLLHIPSLTETLNPLTQYRFGVGFSSYIPHTTDDVMFHIKVFDSTGWGINLQKTSGWAKTIAAATWEEVSSTSDIVIGSGTGVTNLTGVTPGVATFKIAMRGQNTGGSLKTLNIKLDYMFLEHAKGTTTESQGVYTFPEFPLRGSSGFTFRHAPVKRSGHVFDSKRFRWFGFFNNVDMEFFRNLMILNHYQSLGHKMYFHTQEAFGSNFPSIMKGNFTLSNVVKSFWDKKKISFTFDFIEE